MEDSRCLFPRYPPRFFRASYGRVIGTVNRLRLRPMTELGKTKRNGIPCVLTCDGPGDDA